MYAFLSHSSALEALRFLDNTAPTYPRWPQSSRRLPRWGDCVSKQLEFKAFCSEVDLVSYGVTENPVNLLVPEARDRSRGKRASFHVWKHPIPTGSLLRIGEDLFASSPEFVLLQMAAQNLKSDHVLDRRREERQSKGDARGTVGMTEEPTLDGLFDWERKVQLVRMTLVACEFAGTYRLPAGGRDTVYRVKPLMSCEDARSLANSIPHLYGATRVRTALDFAFDHSASPMETALALMLSLPAEFGGYGLPKPLVNEALPTGGLSSLWNGGESITPDLLWNNARLVMEYESDEFHASQGSSKATEDATRANVLSSMGYTMLRATTGNVVSQIELDRLALQVSSRLGIPLAQPDDLTLMRRRKLHALLMQH